jgi:hypothetical protein
VHEILVDVDRNGRFLHVDGRHRCIIAMILGLEAVPVVVRRRHRDWVSFIAEIEYLAHFESPVASQGLLYHQIPHPDLSSLPARHAGVRWALIRPSLPKDARTALDIGAHFGQLSWMLGHEGLDVTAVESNPRYFYFLAKIGASSDLTFRAVNADVLDLPSLSYDCVFALNVLHHMLKTEERFRRLQTLMRRLSTRCLFVQVHSSGDPQMVGAYSSMHGNDFVEWLASHGEFGSVKFLGNEVLHREGVRPLYLLTR